MPVAATVGRVGAGGGVAVGCSDGSVWLTRNATLHSDAFGFQRLDHDGPLFCGRSTEFVTSEGSVLLVGLRDTTLKPANHERLPTSSPVVEAASARYDMVVRCADGSVWVSGENMDGQHGVGHADAEAMRWTRVPVPDAVSVAAGPRGVYVIDVDARLWVCGNDVGTPASGSHRPWCADLPVGAAQVLASKGALDVVDVDGALWTWWPVRGPSAAWQCVDVPVPVAGVAGEAARLTLLDRAGRVRYLARNAPDAKVRMEISLPDRVERILVADATRRWLVGEDGSLFVSGAFGEQRTMHYVQLPPFGSPQFLLLSELAVLTRDTPVSLEALVDAAARLDP